MCGIAGFLELQRRPGTQELEAIAGAMAATLSHRGPDASGVFVDADAGLGFGHTQALHRRSVARRRAADDLGLGPLRHHL